MSNINFFASQQDFVFMCFLLYIFVVEKRSSWGAIIVQMKQGGFPPRVPSSKLPSGVVPAGHNSIAP